MRQHFLKSARARTLSKDKIARMSDDEAYAAFCAIRWAETEGQPVCIWCRCAAVYTISTRRKFKCQNCLRHFSVTSQTIFASHKLSFRQILLAIATFVNGAKGIAALHLSRELDVQFKTAFVLEKRFREALQSLEVARKLRGKLEIDAAYFGGYIKPLNIKALRPDGRRKENKSEDRQCLTVMRERGQNGRSFYFVGKTDTDALPKIIATIEPGSIIYADSAPAYDALHGIFLTKQVNHEERYADGEVSNNQAESWFSRARRMEIGTHHHISGPYLDGYASECGWREDNRRLSNGEQFLMLATACLHHPVSRYWKGYWQWGKDDGREHNRPKRVPKDRRWAHLKRGGSTSDAATDHQPG